MNIISNAIDTFAKTLGIGLPQSLKDGSDFRDAYEILKYTRYRGALKTGEQNAYVTKLQRILRDLGYNCKITGVYDTQTYRAVSDFQTLNNISVNGMVDPVTAYYIMKVTAQKTKDANFIDRATKSWIDQTLYNERKFDIYNIKNQSVIKPIGSSLANNKFIVIGTMGILMYLLHKTTTTKKR